MKKRHGKFIDDTFYVGLIFKAIGGTVETIAAFAVLFISPVTLQKIVSPLANIGINLSEALAGPTQLYIFWYLFSHGIVRLGLAYALIKEYLWAYPVAIAVLCGFTTYQVYLIIETHNWGILGLITLNAVAIVLTVYEYHKLQYGGHLERPTL